MRLSDQELKLVSAKGASQGLAEDESKVGVVEGSSKVPLEDFIRLVRKAKSKTTNAKRGHFKNFFMC
jgi:hypothetical protein